MRFLLGRLSVGLLNAIGRLPVRWSFALGRLLLPLYVPFRVGTRSRLRNLPLPVEPRAYYRMRLRLALLSLRQLLGREDAGTIGVEGSGLYADALASGNPVVLLGWHQGPVELLHRIPARNAQRVADRHPFSVMTASAFSPALAEWMARGRTAEGISVIRPAESSRISALRAWAKAEGPSRVLAVMIDQVPGVPEGFWSLHDGAIRIPRPERLLAWIARQRAECLAVSVRLEPGDRIVFRYDRVRPDVWKEDLSHMLESAIARAPEQYNWSYGKIVVPD